MSTEEEGATSSSSTCNRILNQFIPHPSTRCVRFWQGIVEMIARGVLMVVLVILLITSSVAEDHVSVLDTVDDTDEIAKRNAIAAAGFTVFLGVVVSLYEIAFILSRFLDFVFMTAYRTVVLIVDIIFSGVLILMLFSTTVSLAYHANYANDRNAEIDDDELSRAAASLGATATKEGSGQLTLICSFCKHLKSQAPLK